MLCHANQTIQLIHPLTPIQFVIGNQSYNEIEINLDLELFKGNLPHNHLTF